MNPTRAQDYGAALNHNICARCHHERQEHEVVATPEHDDQYAEVCWGPGAYVGGCIGSDNCPCQGFRDHRKPQPARNYGERSSGGDAYAMGRALNEELRAAWVRYKFLHRLYITGPTVEGKKHPPVDMTYADRVMFIEAKVHLRSLCRIRHAARTSA